MYLIFLPTKAQRDALVDELIKEGYATGKSREGDPIAPTGKDRELQAAIREKLYRLKQKEVV